LLDRGPAAAEALPVNAGFPRQLLPFPVEWPPVSLKKLNTLFTGSLVCDRDNRVILLPWADQQSRSKASEPAPGGFPRDG